MARWSVVVWAVVTEDLEEAVALDRLEAWTALAAFNLGEKLHVHLVLVRPGATSLEIHDWPEGHGASLSNSATLGDVLVRATCWPEADHRLLVLWGHGARSYPSDRDAATLAQARVAVPTAADLVSDALSTTDAKPDIVGYDACRMATVTTVLHLANDVPDALFIGSMVPEPASGWPYYELIQILAHETWTPRAVASAIVEAYASSVSTGDWCMVAVQLAQLLPRDGEAGLAAHLGDLTSSLEVAPDPIRFFTAAQGADILDDTNLVDLGALMRRLKEPTVTASQAQAAVAARNDLVGAIVARKSAGSLAGRHGVAVLLGLPQDGAKDDWAWPDTPGWGTYFPDSDQW
jgi:hypothetical protein